MKQSTHDFMNSVAIKNAGETEFLQAVEEVAEVILPFIDQTPQYQNKMLLERIVEPERVELFLILTSELCIPVVAVEAVVSVNTALLIVPDSILPLISASSPPAVVVIIKCGVYPVKS